MPRLSGPLLTLLATGALAAGLVGVNVARAPAAAAPPPAAASTAQAVPDPAGAVVSTAPTPVQEAAYAGRTADNKVTVAIAVRGDRAVAYLCDGKKVEAWLEGTLTGTTLLLTGPKGASLAGEIREGAVFGSATAAGKKWPFSAALATGPAGTYRGNVSINGVLTKIGWNVLPDGSVTGIATTGDEARPAPPLDPATGTASLDGSAVAVDRVSATDDVS